jgi:hypothetical protein
VPEMNRLLKESGKKVSEKSTKLSATSEANSMYKRIKKDV